MRLEWDSLYRPDGYTDDYLLSDKCTVRRKQMTELIVSPHRREPIKVRSELRQTSPEIFDVSA